MRKYRFYCSSCHFLEVRSFTCEIFSGMQSSRVFDSLNSLWIEDDAGECNVVGLSATRFSLIPFLQSLNITQFGGLFLLLSGKSWQIIECYQFANYEKIIPPAGRKWKATAMETMRPSPVAPLPPRAINHKRFFLCNHIFSDHIKST